jgi:polyhydroxyalkanoate synthesis repressor PhaR
MKIIKKYQNRRMYDVSSKEYITLSDLQSLICKGCDLKVIDVKTSNDITKQILIQSILEQKLFGLENFSNAQLINLITILSDDRKTSYNNFLKESTEHFINIDYKQNSIQTNEERLKANKLTQFWQSITGKRDE